MGHSAERTASSLGSGLAGSYGSADGNGFAAAAPLVQERTGTCESIE